MRGDGVLEGLRALLAARLLGSGGERLDRELGGEVPRHHRCRSGRECRETARLESSNLAVQGLGFGNVLQHRVVLGCAGIEVRADTDQVGQLEEALLLTTERCTARACRQEQRLDAKGVASEEQLSFFAVPDREREHSAQPADRFGAPMVERCDDRFTVALGAEADPVLSGQLIAKLEVVVDFAIEGQRVALGILGRSPAERLMRVLDVDDRETVEAVDHVLVVPGPRFVGTAVTHAVHGGFDEVHPCSVGAGRCQYTE